MPRAFWRDAAPSNLEVEVSRWRSRRRRDGATSDAGTAPTKENISAYFKNCLRSSGANNLAYEKTVKMFDLEDLEVDPDGQVISFKVADGNPEPKAMEFSNGTADHIAALRSLNDRNRRVHERIEAVRVDDRDDQTQPTRAELALVSPTSQTAGNPHGLATFNELARRFWRAA